MRLFGIIFMSASFIYWTGAEDVVCSKKMRKVVTIGEGDTFSFKTQSGQKYAAKTRCQVTYKTGPSCPSIQFSCSEFELDSKKANCQGGDKMTVVGDGTNENFCQTSSPNVTASKTLKVVFTSNKKKQSSGAVCMAQCASDPSTTTTTTAITTTSSPTTPTSPAPMDYVPGTSGGPWSSEELLVIRAKLWRIFTDDQAPDIYKQIPDTGLPAPNPKTDLAFFAAKLLRLSFHDCLRYEDGSGGCDGCLNWEGVGVRFPTAKTIQFKFKYPDVKATNNNGMEHAVAVMEELYTNPNFPESTPQLSSSLKSTGKSRADLWSFAAKVAVEFSIEQNNFQCEMKPTAWAGSYVGISQDCHRSLEKPDCKVHLPREIKFFYGRKDCITSNEVPYKADKEEVHPNQEGNGDSTIDFFKSQYNFTGRETVAIMGGHTLGRMYASHSLLKYVWTSRGGNMFNNAYYRNLVNKDDWFYESEDNGTCLPIGDANGKLPDTKWVPTMNGFTKSGGPMHWIKMHFACTQCTHRPTESGHLKEVFDECCVGKPEDLMCKPDNATRNDEDDIKGCEKYRFAFNLDEMTVNAEIGLYFNFEEVNGIPTSCPGFAKFNMENWEKSRSKTRRAYHPGCSLNMRQEPASDDPLSTIIETYADNQGAWIEDFLPTFEKMMSNGYSPSDLNEAPLSWENVQCTKKDSYKIECAILT